MENNNKSQKANPNYIIAGGAILALCGVGAYYIYSNRQLVNEYVQLVQDYKQEYWEFMEDDEIDSGEQQILDIKIVAMKVLEKEIESRGLIGDVIALIYSVTGLVVAWGVFRIIQKIMEDWFKKHPCKYHRDTSVENEYKDLWDNTWHIDVRDMTDHINETHPVLPDPAPIYDIWTELLKLPEWIVQFLLYNSENGLEIWERGWENTPEWVHYIWAASIAIAVAILVALSLGKLLPVLQPVINAIGAAMAL